MNRHVKQKLIGKVSWHLDELCPVTFLSNPHLFAILSNKFERFEKWFETRKITRAEFEQLIDQNEGLVDAYLDEYSKKATFYQCIISAEARHFQYFLMKNSNGLALLFYRNVELIEV